MELKDYYRSFGIDDDIYEYGKKIEDKLNERFREIEGISEINQMKVITAFKENKVSVDCFNTATGYGYDDHGRDVLEKVYSDIFHTEDALVRPFIACGTHALNIALSGNLRPGDEILAPAGGPYDTLEEVIGIRPSKGSLAEYHITYSQVDLLEDYSFDYDKIKKSINNKTKLVMIQRSKGYASRPSFTIARIEELIKFIKNIKNDLIVMVDNCYGEFVELKEPSDVGADLVVGSLIKNPGGGISPLGGYICGKKKYVENAAYRLFAPGLGKEVGASLEVLRPFYQGLFLAPSVAASALKGAIFAAHCFEGMGYECIPKAGDYRTDIIQAITLKSEVCLKAFCKGIQGSSPVDGFVTPEPWDMPGYDSKVIMAAGAFIQGSSIELSADGPLREPYNVYFQGGLTYPHAKLGILKAMQEIKATMNNTL